MSPSPVEVRWGTPCRRGHIRTPETVYAYIDGRTECRVCRMERSKGIRGARMKLPETPPEDHRCDSPYRTQTISFYKPDDCAIWMSAEQAMALKGLLQAALQTDRANRREWQILLRAVEAAQKGEDRRFGESGFKSSPT